MDQVTVKRSAMDEAVEALHDATAFYTTEPIVEELLGMLNWPGAGRRLVDPSCGDGAFLVAALTKLLRLEQHVTDADIVQQLHGWEIHYFAAAEARARLADILEQYGRNEESAKAVAEAMVTHGDFLCEGPSVPTWDCVAGNPPFLRYANLPALLRELYVSTLPDHTHGDMLHSFIGRCAVVLRTGGEVALVTSDRWLFTQCAAELRATVGKRLGIHHLKRIDCASAFYRPKNRRSGQPPRIHPVAVVLREARYSGTALTGEPIYPDADNAAQVSYTPLQSLATVRLAPWLGRHGLYVIDGATAAAASIPQSMLVPAVDNDNIKGGLYREPNKFAIRTLRNVEPPEAVMRHIDANMHLLARSKVRATQRWLPPESFENLDLDQPSLLLPRIACSLKPVRVPAGVLPLDHAISIVASGALTLDELEEALMRPEAEAWVRARAPRLENGYFSLTARIVRSLPVFT